MTRSLSETQMTSIYPASRAPHLGWDASVAQEGHPAQSGPGELQGAGERASQASGFTGLPWASGAACLPPPAGPTTLPLCGFPRDRLSALGQAAVGGLPGSLQHADVGNADLISRLRTEAQKGGKGRRSWCTSCRSEVRAGIEPGDLRSDSSLFPNPES